MRNSLLVGVLALGVGLGACSSMNQEGGDETPPMNPEEMMAAYAEANAMNENHTRMAEIVGVWDVAAKSWMEPGQPPMENTGTATFTSLLGGRFIQQEYSSEFMGMPYNGIGLSGYDNATKTHFDCWFDSMSTGMFVAKGNWNDDGTTYTSLAEHKNPVNGETEAMKSVLVKQSADSFVFTMYMVTPEGDDVRHMELTYTRSK